MKVTVSCPTRFHAFYLAEQLHKRGQLRRLFTTYFGEWLGKSNNTGIGIPVDRVQTNRLLAFLYYIYSPGSELMKYKLYGNWVAGQLSDEDIVVTWGLSALPIIQKARERNILAIVERGSSHAAYQREILISEYERWGQATDKLHRSFSSARMEQELQEYSEADYISIPSSFVERTFLDQGIPKEKLIRVPYGVNLDEFQQLPKQDRAFRVVFAGAMSLQKGVHYLLQAFAELNLPNAELWLLGGKLPEIDPFFIQYSGKFCYLGQQPQARLHEFYSQCSVFAICSVQEGMAMVQLQGMACGLPLICTPNTGGSDLIENGREGFIVPIRDVEALKEKILFMYEHPETCAEMGRAAKARVEKGYTWDDYGTNITQAYERVWRTWKQRDGRDSDTGIAYRALI